MAPASTFTPKASLCDAPTNLKEAIDWVLRVTGKDGKSLNKDNGECICGLAAAVTDLLQSVELEYNGYDGEGTDPKKGASQQDVTDRRNELFSLVQGLGGTAVVRTYIDQLAQVLSALVGWSRIEQCDNDCTNSGNKKHHGQDNRCTYLGEVQKNTPCTDCGCMKWNVKEADGDKNGHHLGRGCSKCSSGGSMHRCSCGPTGGGTQCTGKECKCAKEGKCCKCCCNGGQCNDGCKQNAKCSCVKENEDNKGTNNRGYRIYHDSYQSAYGGVVRFKSAVTDDTNWLCRPPIWNDLSGKLRGGSTIISLNDNKTASQRRHQCARILLGSVCLIWSGITYMHWTGKYHSSSPYWNNHILDGSGLDDGTLSQWLQALGFPRDMLNNSGPKNRLDKVIWDGFRDKFLLGFLEPSGLNNHHVNDKNGNTARSPYGMNYAGFVHTAHRDSFNTDAATVFKASDTTSGTAQINDTNQHKNGALFKLYILSCAYFTGLQKKSTHSTPRTPKTIREILYWLSALPYSPAYKDMLGHAKESLKKVAPDVGDKKQLSFQQTGRWHPITVDEFNLFAHFQAVTQYCPLVLIAIQGGLHSTKSTDKTTEPAIHALYANTECHFTYPALPIQAYNQVVHYIRALFYQLYFLRKQCAVKVTCGGKWRECRYGTDVVSKGVISWMCLGCNPMEHDRKCRVEKVKGELNGVVNKLKALEGEENGGIDGVKQMREGIEGAKTLLEAIGEVVVQLGNAQERLDTGKNDLDGVMKALKDVFSEGNGNGFKDVLQKVLGKLETEKVNGLEEKAGSLNGLKEATTKAKKALEAAKDAVGKQNGTDVDPCKNLVSAAIHGLQKALEALKQGVEKHIKDKTDQLLKAKKNLSHVIPVGVSVDEEYTTLLNAINDLISLCNSPKCPTCDKHSTKCGKPSKPDICRTCLQPTTTGVPSPLQAFLEDRLPGFSCEVVLNQDSDTPEYPLAASHLGHCGGSGQCCPLPMGFRNNFQDGVIHTGKRLYGILYFFSNENMMQSCVYTLVRVTAALSATTPQVLGDVFGFFRGGVGNKDSGKNKKGSDVACKHDKDPSNKGDTEYFCGWCASGLRDVVKSIEWIQKITGGDDYRETVGSALIEIKGEKGAGSAALKSSASTITTNTSLSRLTENCQYLSPLTGELYTAVSATFGGTYLSWVLYLSDALEGGLKSLSEAFLQIECRGCKGCDPNKCKKGHHGEKGTGNSGQCQCQSIVSCTGVLPVLYRHGFGYGNPFNLEGYQQKNEKIGDYSITENKDGKKHCHEFLESLKKVIERAEKKSTQEHPLTNLLSQVGKLQYDIRLPWIFVLTVAWLVAVLYLAFGAIWPLDWVHMRSHWLRGGEHQWQCMWYKVMTGRKGVDLMEYFSKQGVST